VLKFATVTNPSPTFMDPAKAAEVLRATLDPHAPVTVADAAAKSGLALRDAERGLQALTTEYRGRLRVSDDGDLVHVFPTGFSKPWQTRDAVDRALAASGRAIAGAMRFVTRAWITIVLVGYALLFFAILLGITFAGNSNDSRRRDFDGGRVLGAFLRVLGDAFFWTFHPFSPFYAPAYAYGGGPVAFEAHHPHHEEESPRVPLYEKVNRFFYGPQPEPEDPRAHEKAIVAAIRAGKGRIGLGDVMRVTGLSREEADPMMARLMLDYDGDVDVSEDGGIVYRFPALRKTAGDAANATDAGSREPPAAWQKPPPALPPLTGNSFGANLGIVALNGFNLLFALFAITNHLTIANLEILFSGVRNPVFEPGVALALGVVPFAFSLFLFLIPIGRALLRPLQERKVAAERGRLAVLREVIERTNTKRPVTDASVEAAWSRATGAPADRVRIARELTELGGDVAIDEAGATRWRFVDLETEAAAVEAERTAAKPEEARLGPIVFDTETS
jgi:hypothetical protein